MIIKNKKIIFILFFTILILLLFNIKVNAVSAKLSASSTDVSPGTKVTITTTIQGAAWQINVSGAVSGSYSDNTDDAEDATITKTLSFTPNEPGTYKVNLSGNVTGGNDTASSQVSDSITINVKGKTSENNNNESNNTTTKSSEARLSNLGIKPNDFKGFKRDNYSYNVEVPNEVSEVNVYGTAADSKAKVTGTGKVSLKEGSNTAKVVVTAEDGKTTKTYTININRSTEKTQENDSDATLKNLGISPKEYDFSGFKKDVFKYNTEVPNNIKEIEVYAEATNPNSTITGTGKIELKEGNNTANVEVTAKDGTKKIYSIEIVRKTEETSEKDNNKNFGLSKLSIKNFKLNPEFNTEIYEYKLDLNKDESSLQIETEATEKDASIEIIGNENLKEGENIITILVSSSDSEKIATYQIIVNKDLSLNSVGKYDWINPLKWNTRERIIMGIIALLFLIIIVVIIIKIRLSRKYEDDDEFDLPGAEELDKAISEHQELTEEEIENKWKENTEYNVFEDNYYNDEISLDNNNYEHNDIIDTNSNLDYEIEEEEKIDYLDEEDDNPKKRKRRGRGKHF